MRKNCGEFGEQDKWEKQNVNRARNRRDGIGGIQIIVGTAIIRITVTSASG